MLKGVASGLIPMAIFIPFYAVWPLFVSLPPGLLVLLGAAAWATTLAISAAKLLRLARELPQATNADDDRIAKGMAIVGGVQGGLILISLVTLIALGRWPWILPATAVIVALHFFALPWIFRRTIDYYLGAAMLIVALAGLYLAVRDEVGWQYSWAAVGIGATLVLSGYGWWMRNTARRLLAEYRSTPERRT